MAYDVGDRVTAVNPLSQLVNMTFDTAQPAGQHNSTDFDDSEGRKIEPAHELGTCTNMIYDLCHACARTGQISNPRASLAAYAIDIGCGLRPAMDATSTIRPKPCSIMPDLTAHVSRADAEEVTPSRWRDEFDLQCTI